MFAATNACLQMDDPASKCAAVRALWSRFRRGEVVLDFEYPLRPIGPPGRPPKPELIDAAAVPRRRLGSKEGRLALVHAVAHIEFNAINLALDAAYRFRDMPSAYYGDWLSVAADEARHFSLLAERLREMGSAYGELPAHNGLWEMAEKTASNCLERMALVPRVLEARGLDVTPGMIERLRGVGDLKTVAALEIILDEEVGHVAIGSRWFRFCCERENREPTSTFLGLLRQHFAQGLRGPFNIDARYAAGFSAEELDAIS